MIPDFIDGVLPEGIHTCTLEEVVERFGRIQESDRRLQLTARLVRYVNEVRKTGTALAIIIDGSYVTMKAKPNDIDIIMVLRQHSAVGQDMTPSEYRIQSMRMIKKEYGFDLLVSTEGSEACFRRLELFALVRQDDPDFGASRKTKGVVRINI